MGTETIVIAGRPHAERIRKDLDEVRKELAETVQNMTPDDLNWVPNADAKMRPVKDILQEIGTMETITLSLAAHGEYLEWGAAMQAFDKDTVADLLAALTDVRRKTQAYLDTVSEETMEALIPLNEEWQGYFNAPTIEREEMFRWLVRHEYYHLGQIITYQWQRGHNPNADA